MPSESFSSRICQSMAKFFSSLKRNNTYKRLFPSTDDIPRVLEFSSASSVGSSQLLSISNERNNKKYTVYNFIPKFLFEQFSQFSNLYFLLIAVSQLIPSLQVGFIVTYIVPLFTVLGMAIITETMDEAKRRKKDVEINSSLISVFSSAGSFRNKYEREVRVGELVFVTPENRPSMDLLLLATSSPDGQCYIKTDQLDGETDWKLRVVPDLLAGLRGKNKEEIPEWLRTKGISVRYDAPSNRIYEFEGEVSCRQTGKSEKILLENTIWASTSLVSDWAIGLVLYTGKDTKIERNVVAQKTKFGKTEREVNKLMKITFFTLIFCAASLIDPRKSSSYSNRNAFVSYLSMVFSSDFLRYVILFSHMIPMSLRLSIDTAKIIWASMISRDKDLAGIEVHNTTIPEEMGRVSFLFTDKTGTLTENVMKVKKVILKPNLFFSDKQLRLMRSRVQSLFLKRDEEMSEKELLLKKGLLNMAVCHNINTTCSPEEASRDQRTNRFLSSSPDELALVELCEELGIVLHQRTKSKLVLQVNNTFVEYEIVKIFPFNSTEKRMGIIMNEAGSSGQEYDFFVKGAEKSIERISNPNSWFLEETENLARDGLRTLVFAHRKVSGQELREILAATDSVDFSTVNFEIEMISGIEDRLQESVQNCLEILKSSGVKIWMLTGDKDETALCVARSAKLVGYSQPVARMTKLDEKSREDVGYLVDYLAELGSNRNNALIISGEVLEILLSEAPYSFVRYVTRIETVLCCRCSPEQKASIVRLVGSCTGKNTAAIGDGGNDISMIREASIGLGIIGKEGKQAAAISDYALPNFGYLQKLFLWHGRNSYKNIATLALQIVTRGLLISLVQYLYSWIYYRIPISMFGDMPLMLYSTVYTGFLIMVIVVDRDIRYRVIILYPELYKEMLKGRALNFKNILVHMQTALYQATAIIFTSAVLFKHSDVKLSSIAFSAVLFTAFVNILLSMSSFTRITYGMLGLSVGLYLLSLIVMRSVYDHSFIFSWTNLWKTLITIMFSVTPVWVCRKVSQKFYPPLSSKFKFY